MQSSKIKPVFTPSFRSVFCALRVFCCLLFSAGAPFCLADEVNNEYKIKAAYLYNFSKFVTWPSDSGINFNLCILGSDPFGEVIDPIENKTVLGRPIKLYRIMHADDMHCHILFVSNSVPGKISVKGSLVVRDSLPPSDDNPDGMSPYPGMINFINKAGKIKLKINLPIVKQAELSVSAKLLEVAEVIGGSND